MTSPIDLRDLEPPEPMLRILDAIDAGAPGPMVYLLAREPLPLYALLGRLGWRCTTRRDDRGVELTVYKP